MYILQKLVPLWEEISSLCEKKKDDAQKPSSSHRSTFSSLVWVRKKVFLSRRRVALSKISTQKASSQSAAMSPNLPASMALRLAYLSLA